MTRTMLLATALLLLVGACDASRDAAPPGAPTTPLPPDLADHGDHATRGSATEVDAGAPPDARAQLPVDDPSRAAFVGRPPRRLDIDQFRASLEQVLGARWTGPQTVWTPAAPSGSRFEPEADLLEFFAGTLGRPDYVISTDEVLEPTITFAKLAVDAVRNVCAAGVRRDAARPAAERLLLVDVGATDTLPASEAAIRRNVATLSLRLWGMQIAPESDAASGILGVFRAAVTQPGATPLDAWRAVCIDLATDPRFLSY